VKPAARFRIIASMEPTNKPFCPELIGFHSGQRIAMLRFYFGVREGPSFTPDDQGFEFDSLDEAECGAATSAAEIGRARLPKGDAQQVTVEPRNEHRQRVLTVTVAMQINRVDPLPKSPRRGEIRGAMKSSCRLMERRAGYAVSPSRASTAQGSAYWRYLPTAAAQIRHV